MGRAARWFLGFLGMRKDREAVAGDAGVSSASGDRREKKRWSFSRPSKEPNGQPLFADVPPRHSGAGEALWLDTEKEEQQQQQQSRHANAIAVAAATAKAADAAVAAAEAAVAVVRLTAAGQGRGGALSGSHGKEVFAALRIQSVFRGFLARKALRALRGIVKLQALIRGFLVRKRAATTLHRMESLIRAQSTVRSQRARRSIDKENRHPVENRPRRSTERYEESRSEFHSKRLPVSFDILVDDSPKVVEVDSVKSRSRSRRISNSPLSEPRERIPFSSPIPVSTPDCGQKSDFEWCMVGNDFECRFNSSGHSTPGFTTPRRNHAPTTPVIRSARGAGAGDGLFHPYSGVPSYMANTKSFRAKTRSQSAPKQRPEEGCKKRLALSEIMGSRNSISSIRMDRSFSHLEEIFE